MARCRKLVSPPLSPPARPWPSAGRDAGRPALSAALPAPLPAGGHTRPPPGGLPAAYSSLARTLLADYSLLVFQHFLSFTKMICYAIVIIDLRIFTFCPKSQIFLNKLCLSSWLKIAGYLFYNISPPKEKRPHPYSGEVRPFFFFWGEMYWVGMRPCVSCLLVRISKSKVKYIYQNINIYKTKLLNCHIYIKNPN